MTSLKNFDKLLELLIQSQSIRLNITGNQECLLLPKENQKLRENDQNEQKFRNIKTSFSTSETSQRFINHLEEQMSLLREQLRNKDKIIS